MQWIPGTPLMEFSGVFPLLAEEQQELSSEALAIRWISVICEALRVLHRNGLVHGDVSPKNMIVSGSDLVLTDYDFVSKVGEPTVAPGTILYCSPSYTGRQCSADSDDIYALAASFFHVVFEKEPFRYGGELDKERGLNWEGVDRGEYPTLAAFLDKATHQDSQSRFTSVTEALAALGIQDSTDKSTQVEKVEPVQAEAAAKAKLNVNVNAHIQKGDSLIKQGQFKRAIVEYDKAIRLNPKYALAYNNRGIAYRRLKQYRRAIEDYNTTLRLNPKFAKAYYNRGISYLNLKQYRRAIQDYNEAIRLNPSLYLG